MGIMKNKENSDFLRQKNICSKWNHIGKWWAFSKDKNIVVCFLDDNWQLLFWFVLFTSRKGTKHYAGNWKIGSHLWPPVLCKKLCYVWDEPGQVAGDEDAYNDDGYPGETDVPFPQGLCPTAPGAGVTAQLFSRPILNKQVWSHRGAVSGSPSIFGTIKITSVFFIN